MRGKPARVLGLFVTLLAAAVPALAARSLSIDQLRQLLAAAQSAHRSDNNMVQQLADVKLTERLSTSTLQQLTAASPGPKTTESLRALADSSALLDPPASEIPPTPAPNVAAQRALLSLTVHYVARTLPSLPNFVATRVTEQYGRYPAIAPAATEPELADGLYRIGTLRSPIAFRDGKETDDPSVLNASQTTPKASGKKSKDGKQSQATATPSSTSNGLTSWGEFGPILGVILVDVAKGKLNWSRWEQLDGKQVAVFQFSVDRSNSHYNLQYCCVAENERIGSSYGSRGGEGISQGMVKQGSRILLHQISGYHGSMAIDPATGTVLRIALEADLEPQDPIQRAAMVVEYGAVKIGDSEHICPTRSVSISVTRETFQSSAISAIQTVSKTLVNDVQFTGYRRFGSEATLILGPAPKDESTPAVEAANDPASPPAPAATDNADPAAAPPAAAPPSSSPAETAAAGGSPAPPSVSPAAAPLAAATTGASAESDEEFLVREVSALPGMDANPIDAASGKTDKAGNFTLQVTTRLVGLSLLAFDKHGKPISDLKQGDIEIYDNGRRQQLRSFRHPDPSEASGESVAPVKDDTTFSNSAPPPAETEAAPDTMILLLDESHLAYNDLNTARQEVLRYLKSSRAGTRMALYALNEHGFRVIQDITPDRALIASRLAAWTPSASAVSQAQQLEARNRQQFDTVRNTQDLNSVNGNNIQAPDTIQTTDPQLRQMGDNPLRSALESMIALARHFAPVPGHKSLVWVSGDTALADFEDQAVGREKGNKYVEAALTHTRETLNEAHMALYAIDASALGQTVVDASLANAEVEVNPVATANSAPGGIPHDRIGQTGRLKDQMQQNTRGIQAAVVQLAESTGGRAVNRGSDIAKALGGVEDDSRALYELGFGPDTPADGKFHTLTIKVPGHKDAKLRYRSGYVYSEEAPNTQQRFQQAVWSPQDATGIGLTADVRLSSGSDDPTSIQLRIALKGVSLEHQADRWKGQLYIFIAQRDDATQKATITGDTLKISLRQVTYDAGMPAGIPYHHTIEAPPKLGTVRVIVVDGATGQMGSVTLPASALRPSLAEAR